MGAELARLVTVSYRGLNGRAFKMLNAMAWTALDRPNAEGMPARLYFAGWEPLAVAIGLEVTGLDARGRSRVYESVRRTLSELEKVDAVQRLIDHPRTGTRQTFRLTLSAAGAPAKGRGTSPSETQGLCPSETQGLQPLRKAGVSPCETQGPRKELGGTEDLLQDSTTSSPLSPHGDAREDAADGMPDRAADTDARFLAAQAARQSIATARQAAQR